MRIFYDVDTQNDFMNKDGALYVPDAEEIKPTLAKLTNYARTNHIPVLGSVDRHFGTEEYKHRETELQKWGGPFPNHCMNNTLGQWKIPSTVLSYAPTIASEDGYSFAKYIDNPWFHDIENPRKNISKHILERWQELGVLEETLEQIESKSLDAYFDEIQKISDTIKKIQNGEMPNGIYFEKQTYNVFDNLLTEAVLKSANVTEAIVYGVATDYCVKAAVLGMQKRGIQCYVVKDAIKGVDPKTTKSALEEMVKIGAKLITTKQVLEDRL